MNHLRHLGIAALLSFATHPALAGGADYELDPVHTRVMVAVQHAGFSRAIGTVSGSSGRLHFDPDDWTTARLDVRVPMQRMDLGDEKWNKAVKAANLLDVEKFPEARFVSTSIEPIDSMRASVQGELTLHGVTRPVKLDVVLNALKRHPLPPFRRTAGFSASTTISRAAFGIDAWKSVIGDDVEIRLEVEATRTRNRNAGEADDDAEPDTQPQHEPAQEPATP